MEIVTRHPADPAGLDSSVIARERVESYDVDHAVSWSAIVAGAAGAAALSLILLILGTGLGLASVSPWTREGMSAGALGVTAILWLTITQLLASGLGGYIAGRLGAQWKTVHSDEAYFRDTAHGFLAWAVASLATAALLTSVIGSIVGTGVQATAAVAGGAAATAAAKSVPMANSEGTRPTSDLSTSLGYLVDTLFRKEASTAATPGIAPVLANDAEQSTVNTAAETTRIFTHAVRTGTLLPEDARYLGQLISQRTGISQADAEKRVTTGYARLQANLKDAEVAAREAADKARKASAYSALWLFISLLIGAFCASLAATYGGRQRRA
jgi:hypothetical protein